MHLHPVLFLLITFTFLPLGLVFIILRLRLATASRRCRRLLFLFIFILRVVIFVIGSGRGDSRASAGRRPITGQDPPVLLLEGVEDGLEEVDLRISRPFHVVVNVFNTGQVEDGSRHPTDAVNACASRCGLQSYGSTTFPSRCLEGDCVRSA